MVSESLILKHLNDAISKCSRNTIKSNSISWGVRFNKSVREALDIFRRETCTMSRRLRFEKLQVLNNDGDVVYSNSNYDEGSVTYDVGLMRIYRASEGELHLTHNHPQGYYRIPTCLSWADAKSLLATTHKEYGDYLFRSITAETSNGSRMTLIKNKDFNLSNHNDFGRAYNHLNKEYHQYLSDFLDKKLELTKDYENIAKGFAKKYPNPDTSIRDRLLEDYLNEKVVKEIGTLEDRLVDVRREFNECNVEFGVEWSRKGVVI